MSSAVSSLIPPCSEFPASSPATSSPFPSSDSDSDEKDMCPGTPAETMTHPSEIPDRLHSAILPRHDPQFYGMKGHGSANIVNNPLHRSNTVTAYAYALPLKSKKVDCSPMTWFHTRKRLQKIHRFASILIPIGLMDLSEAPQNAKIYFLDECQMIYQNSDPSTIEASVDDSN